MKIKSLAEENLREAFSDLLLFCGAGLAERVGCSVSTIRKLEDEERRPSAQIAELLAEIFKLPTNERTAFLQFARGDWRSAPGLSGEEAPWHVPTQTFIQRPRSNLPGTSTSLIGRDKNIAAVRDYLKNPGIRLVTLMSPPGIGKTRLSIESASQSLAHFPDGVFFVARHTLTDDRRVSTVSARGAMSS